MAGGYYRAAREQDNRRAGKFKSNWWVVGDEGFEPPTHSV